MITDGKVEAYRTKVWSVFNMRATHNCEEPTWMVLTAGK